MAVAEDTMRPPASSTGPIAWARKNLTGQPIEINRADRSQLLRIPGIGPKGAEVILRVRRQSRICEVSALKKMGILADRAAPFLLLDGRRPVFQPGLF